MTNFDELNHACKHDAELVEELVRLREQIDAVRWNAILFSAEAQQYHSDRDCECPLSLGERLSAALADEVVSGLCDMHNKINNYLGVKRDALVKQ